MKLNNRSVQNMNCKLRTMDTDKGLKFGLQLRTESKIQTIV